jgi:hypothetical protein
MIRIREILDPELRERVRTYLSDQRGVAIPDWFELDDLDYVDVLNALRDEEAGRDGEWGDDDRE